MSVNRPLQITLCSVVYGELLDDYVTQIHVILCKRRLLFFSKTRKRENVGFFSI